MSVSLAGQNVLVVGASSGIGRATAIQFAQEGARVMAAARRQDRLRELRDQQSGIETFAADTASLASMQQLAEATRELFGSIDILVFATGTNTPDRAMNRLTPPIWDRMIQVNLNGAYYITQALLPAMRQARSGHLIYIASVSGLAPDASGAAYQASKRGMLALSHAIRFEEKQNGIRTCVVCPGLVDTEILDHRPVKPSPETLAQALRSEDVAEVVLSVARLHPRAVIPELHLEPTAL
jgi:serine 3-dehydrogenase (NADP+)